MKFEQYEIRESGVANGDAFLPWGEIKNLVPGRGETLTLTPRSRKSPRISIALDEKNMSGFLHELFAVWGRHSRGTAAKVAFDYGNNSNSVGWIWIVMSLIFPGLMALMLLGDGFGSLMCSRKLEREGTVAQAQVQKVKKNKRGNYTWNLEFKTAAGEAINGKRVAYVYDAKGNPTGGVTVVYAESDLSCWDVSMKPGINAVNMRQRVFSEWMTLSFGGAFGLCALAGVIVGIWRLRKRFPHAALVREAGDRLIGNRQPA